jgi:hydroxyacylglutathione hydrolase
MGPTYTVHQLRTSSDRTVNYNYIIVDEATGLAALVDPAWEADTIIGKLEELGVTPAMLLLTHAHNDHVDLADALARRYGIPAYMSGEEIVRYGFQSTGLQSFEDDRRLLLGRTEIACLVTPGHTTGSACFLLAGDMFTGDTVFIEGCGICTQPGGDPHAMYRSFQRIKPLLQPHVRIWPGHRFNDPPGQTMSFLLQYNIYFQIDKEEHFVSFRMRKNQTHHAFK